jgi:hypothetical protein
MASTIPFISVGGTFIKTMRETPGKAQDPKCLRKYSSGMPGAKMLRRMLSKRAVEVTKDSVLQCTRQRGWMEEVKSETTNKFELVGRSDSTFCCVPTLRQKQPSLLHIFKNGENTSSCVTNTKNGIRDVAIPMPDYRSLLS